MNRVKNLILIVCVYGFALINRLRFRKHQKRFVIFHTGKLGDLVCVTPLFRAVKESLPGVELILYARKPFIEILKGNPYLDTIVGYKEEDLSNVLWVIRTAHIERQKGVAHFVNLTSSFEANVFGVIAGADKHRGLVTHLDSRLQRIVRPLFECVFYRHDRLLKLFYLEMVAPLGVQAHETKNQLFFEGGSSEIDALFNSHGVREGDVVIGVCVSSGKEFKRWPREYWIELLTKFTYEYDARIVFFGTKAERTEIEEVRGRILGKSIVICDAGLSTLPYYLQRCNLFVSVDTGPLYIADALGVPVVDIMGPVDETNQCPENKYRLVMDRKEHKPVLHTPTVTRLTNRDYREIEKQFSSLSAEQVIVSCRELLPPTQIVGT